MSEAEVPAGDAVAPAPIACVIVDPRTGPLSVAVRSVDTHGAVLDTDLPLKANEYIDASLELATGHRHSLFAHVIGSGDDGLELRWLHFDPSEERKLVDFLAGRNLAPLVAETDDVEEHGRSVSHEGTRRITHPSGSGGTAETGSTGRRKTRKIVRPRVTGDDSSTDITPFSASPAIVPASDASEEEPQPLTRRKTRKVVRPRSTSRHKTVRPFVPDEQAPATDTQPPAPKTADGPSGAHDVVLTTTRQYRRTETKTASGRLTKRNNVVGDDGRLDVGATIRSKAKTVSASELAARHEQVRVLNMRTIKSLIQDAVAEAVRLLGSQLDEAEKRRLLEEAEEEFQQRLKAFQAENKGLQAQAESLGEQLKRAEQLLEEERLRKIEADQFTVSDAGLADMEKRFQRIVTRAIASNTVSPEVEGELKGIIAKLLDEEREHIAEQARKAHGEAIALLEKKVTRLARSLDETEQERDKAHRAMKVLQSHGGGVALQNVMDVGLKEDDPEREQKLHLLKDIFQQNKDLRDELAAQGVVIQSRRLPAVAPVQADELDQPAEPAAVAEGVEAGGPEPIAIAVAADDAADDAAVAAEGPDESVVVDAEAMVDPDDQPWEIGMSARTDPPDDDEAIAGGVRSISAVDAIASFVVPPLQRDGAAVAASDDDDAGAVAEDAGDADPVSPAGDPDTAEAIDPDDMPWEPTHASEPEGTEDADSGGVKRIDASQALAAFKPPPLRRDG